MPTSTTTPTANTTATAPTTTTAGTTASRGRTDDPAVLRSRARPIQRALLATLLLARGTPMLAMGAETGHSQAGNNNAYAQDNALSWIDWQAWTPSCSPSPAAWSAPAPRIRLCGPAG